MVQNPVYGRIHRAAMAKCTAIWNKVSRSPKACEEYVFVMHTQPLCPCPTRWNSLYDSVCSLVKDSTKLKELCTVMGISPFKDPDIKFLAKFVQCMQPITDSLDRLQGDKQCYMADVIPTFLRTKKKLEIISQKTLAHCHPLCRGLLQSLNKRFGEYLCLSDNVSEYIVASTAHPFFKLRWVPSDHVGHVR